MCLFIFRFVSFITNLRRYFSFMEHFGMNRDTNANFINYDKLAIQNITVIKSNLVYYINNIHKFPLNYPGKK